MQLFSQNHLINFNYMKIERLFDFLEYYKTTYPQKQDALASKIDGEWVKYSITEYSDIVRDLAYGLINLLLLS